VLKCSTSSSQEPSIQNTLNISPGFILPPSYSKFSKSSRASFKDFSHNISYTARESELSTALFHDIYVKMRYHHDVAALLFVSKLTVPTLSELSTISRFSCA
jgi:hypothetical protein